MQARMGDWKVALRSLYFARNSVRLSKPSQVPSLLLRHSPPEGRESTHRGNTPQASSIPHFLNVDADVLEAGAKEQGRGDDNERDDDKVTLGRVPLCNKDYQSEAWDFP